jgi:uncharacterized membrane protein YfcA
MKEMEFWGMVATFGCLWVANMGGTCGGGIMVPIGIAFFKFDPKDAIAISNFSVFLSSAMRYLMHADNPHPLKNGKGLLVDYNIAVIMLPLIISGVSFGALLNIIIPNLIVMFFFCALLSYLGYSVFKKAMGMRSDEMANLVIEMSSKIQDTNREDKYKEKDKP